MATKTAAKRHRFDATRKPAREHLRKGASKGTRKAVAARTTTRRATRPSEETFPELGDIKDPMLMKHARAYADEMFVSEQALERAGISKQAIRSRMGVLDSTIFTGHGYEFARTTGEESFTARKVKRGSAPPDTVHHTQTAPPPHEDGKSFGAQA